MAALRPAGAFEPQPDNGRFGSVDRPVMILPPFVRTAQLSSRAPKVAACAVRACPRHEHGATKDSQS